MYKITNNNMSNSTHSMSTMSLEKWKEIMNGVPGVSIDKVDKVDVRSTSDGGIISISFVSVSKEEKKKTDQQISLELLARSDQPCKWIVMGKNYNKMGNLSLRPFGSVLEAIAYGEQLTARMNSLGYRYYNSFVIQPLLKDMKSFELTSEQIHMIRDIEATIV